MEMKLVSEDEMSNQPYNVEEYTKSLFDAVIDYFQKNNPTPTTELKYRNGYKLLVATILSARCPDKRVNMVTPKLFEAYPTPDKLAAATPEEVLQYIGSVTFPISKSGHLVRMAKMLVDNFNGIVPEDEEDLQKLPGVGRKTANVIAATLFNKSVIAVDTHVLRVAERIGLTNDAETPLQSEEQLLRNTPKEVMSKMSHWLILHGRYICTAKNCQCNICEIRKLCRYYRKRLENISRD